MEWRLQLIIVETASFKLSVSLCPVQLRVSLIVISYLTNTKWLLCRLASMFSLLSFTYFFSTIYYNCCMIPIKFNL